MKRFKEIDIKFIKNIENRSYTDEFNIIHSIDLKDDKLFEYIDFILEFNYLEHSYDGEKSEVVISKNSFYKEEIIEEDEVLSEVIVSKYFYYSDYRDDNYGVFNESKFYQDVLDFVNAEMKNILYYII
ncbi:hypothetical protein FPD46_00470 [Campylobacter peloridis]|uniref:Uncharacterized protein n=1 Tax=Campylobacter peloridis TaxID=488546 RepID=A0A5C7DYE8_9BACT|nr:hypothetical protein [Campylobacter peloridis]TXE84742.1 hypothetical protein FPD46_00470 [Campylobacter peloridis]